MNKHPSRLSANGPAGEDVCIIMSLCLARYYTLTCISYFQQVYPSSDQDIREGSL